MKKVLSLLLCLCMLAGVLVCFSSCKKKAEIDLVGYQLVYDSEYKNSLATWASGFGQRISAYAQTAIKVGNSSLAETPFEILLGHTDRPETEKMLAKIEGEGYAYGVINDKLVLVGTTNLMTVAAAEAFRKACLSGEGGTALTVEETVVSNAPTVEISATYNVVYNADWDTTKNDNRESPSYTGENPDGYDYGYIATQQVKSALKTKVQSTSTSLQVITDKTAATAREVQVGRLARRDASLSFIKSMGVEEYGVALYGETVVIGGHNENGLRLAVTMFEELIAMGATTNDSGRKVVSWPAELRMTATKDFGWVLDVPKPEGEGVELTGSVDVGEGSVELYYTGQGVNADAFNQYCAKLVGDGYELLQENTIEGSIFRTYRNTTAKVLIYTAYAAYAHAFEQDVNMFSPCIRVVTAKSNSVGNDYDADIFTPKLDTYTKVTDSSFTNVRYDYGALGEDGYVSGNCYVMQLEDGSFIVMDGGVGASAEYKRVYEVLADLHKRAFGTAPSTEQPITIAAWYLTHSHNDHYVTFVDMCKKNGQKLKVELLIANNASDIECYNAGNPNLYVRNTLSTIANYTQGSMKYIKVHTGQKLYVRNLELEVLYTHEDLYPQTLLRFNNTSTVVQATFNNTDGSGHVQGTPTKVLWLGDLETRGSACLRAMFGSYVESDVVQMAHHGGNGSELELYLLTKASIVLWPCRATSMHTYASAKSATAAKGSAKYVSYHTFHMESVKYNIACDVYNLTITMTASGPNMTVGGASGLYDAADGKTVVIGGTGGSIIAMD